MRRTKTMKAKIELNKTISELNDEEDIELCRLVMLNKSIFACMSTKLTHDKVFEDENIENDKVKAKIILRKEENDNEAEIMDFIEILRIMQKQKNIIDFEICYEELFLATWDLNDSKDGEYLLEGSPYDDDEEEYDETPFHSLLNE